MFNNQQIAQLAKANAQGLKLLKRVEDELNKRFYDSKSASRALIMAVATGEPLLFIGPPGTAKSQMVRTFCELIGLIGGANGTNQYFEYLLSPFTEPAELFGYYDLAALTKANVLRRLDDHSLQKAKVVFLDEVFNGSSALMNSLLAVMNERIFHDRGQKTSVALQCLFSATNSVPQTSELLAFYDRFLFRVRVDNAGTKVAPNTKFDGQHKDLSTSIHSLIHSAWEVTYRGNSSGSGNQAPSSPSELGDLLKHMEKLRKNIRSANQLKLKEVPSRRLTHLVSVARQRGLSEMSNRRVIKMVHAMLIHRLYREVVGEGARDKGLGTDDLNLAWRFFLDREEPIGIDKMMNMPGEG